MLTTIIVAATLIFAQRPLDTSPCDSVHFPIVRPAGETTLLATMETRVDNNPELGAKILAGRLDAAVTAPGPAMFVAWKHTPDCKPVAWKTLPPWEGKSEPAVYSGRLRPRAAWIKGVRTYDVYLASLQPIWTPTDHRVGFFSGSPIATAQEFFDFHANLPTDQELAAKSPVALKRLDAWEAANQKVAASEPIRTIIGNLRRAWRGPK
jgi:hypothetical protein